MEHYMALIRDNNRSGVVKLEIVNDVDFEIKIQFMKELRHNLFPGTEDEDTHGHVQMENRRNSELQTRDMDEHCIRLGKDEEATLGKGASKAQITLARFCGPTNLIAMDVIWQLMAVASNAATGKDRALEGGRQRVLREGRRDALGSYEGEKSEGSDKNYGCERKDEEGERGGERGGSEKPRVGGKERERDDKGGEELETVRRRESTTKWGSKGRRRDAGD
ncbi:hypothetical protein Tco_0941048 [Tanacetum coccineum]|uniref:Uncharacterized protein n=1 Tax=Tanacetum coccineum TaxID=301880 RepID=A0ABQ5DQM6_9ASTR